VLDYGKLLFDNMLACNVKFDALDQN